MKDLKKISNDELFEEILEYYDSPLRDRIKRYNDLKREFKARLKKPKEIDDGRELLKLLRQQRKTFTRDIDGKRIVTDSVLYYKLENEIYDLQMKIGRTNERMIAKRLKKTGAKIIHNGLK